MTKKILLAGFLFYSLTGNTYAQTTDACKAEVDAAVKAATAPSATSVTTTPTQTNTTTVTQTVTVQIPQLTINEFMPDPEGTDSEEEWIEIKNPTDQEVSLDGWELDDSDGGSKSFSLKDKKIPAKGFLVVKSKETKIALNNTVDQVRLMAPNGQFTDIVSYSDTKTGESYARAPALCALFHVPAETNCQENNWIKETHPTPGTENTHLETMPEIKTEPPKTEVPKTTEPKIETLNEVIPKTETVKIPEKNEEKAPETATGDLSEDLEISEVFPNPKGPDKSNEWIEIHNTGDETIHLRGWEIATKSKKFEIPDHFVIKPGGYISFNFDDIKLTLKNGPNEIFLIDPEKNEMDFINYDEAPENVSFAKVTIHEQNTESENKLIPVASAQGGTSEKNREEWRWTEDKTPGKANPVYEVFEGKMIEKGVENFSVRSGQEKILVDFRKQKINPDLIALAVQQEANVKITAKKKGENQYELESYEVIQKEKNEILEGETKNTESEEEKSGWSWYWIIGCIAAGAAGFQLQKFIKAHYDQVS